MPDKYSLAKCEHYGRRLAARLCQQVFDTQPQATVDGPALLKLTPIRQVNLLVVKQLLGRWQREAAQLRSPYFDFEAEAVRTALTQFMNVLSRHIGLGRAALEPLLAQAVADTLLLAANPAQAFERLLLPAAGASTTAAALHEQLRYFDQSKAFFQGFVDSLPGGTVPLDAEFLRQRFALHCTANVRELPALARVVAEFAPLLPLTEADLWDDGPSKAAPAPVATKPAAAPAPIPAAAPVATAPAAQPPAAPAVAAASAPTPPAPAPPFIPNFAAAVAAPAAVPAPVTAPVVAAPAAPIVPPAPQPVAAAPAAPLRPVPAVGQAADVPLYEKLKAAQPTAPHLASTLREAATPDAPPLAERAAPRVGSLREAVSINQRFSFINELFNGESDDYQAAVEALDAQPDLTTAQAYVRQVLALRYDWSRKEDHVARLLKLIERKFGGA